MKAIRSRLSAAVFALLWVILCAAVPVSAKETKGTLSLWCVKEDEILEGMHWRIYRVGHREERDYVFEGDFAGYRLTLGNRTRPMLEWSAETIASAAETLRSCVIMDKIMCRSEGDTDENGYLCFPELENGLYLVIGESLDIDAKTYIPSAIFFEMDSERENKLDAFPKIVYVTLNKQSTRYSVKKIWANDENQPPDENTYISCELYRDGEYQDTVRLDRSNNWTYRWTDTNEHEWLVKEKEIPKNYSVIYNRRDTEYVIVNTYEEDIVTTTTETETGTQMTHTETTVTEATGTEGTGTLITNETLTDTQMINTQTTAKRAVTTTTVSVPERDKLPQTGQLWWPVPLLGGGGIALIAAGVWFRRKERST